MIFKRKPAFLKLTMMNEIHNIVKRFSSNGNIVARGVSSLLVKRGCIFLLFLFVGFKSFAQSTLVTWNFPTNFSDAVADGGIPANASCAITYVNANDAAMDFSNAGNTTNCASLTDWTNGSNLKCFIFSNINTVGYSSIQFSADMRGSNGASPGDFKIQYRVNNGVWTDVGGAIALTTNWATVANGLLLPTAVNNQSDVDIRVIQTSNTSINNGTIGTNRWVGIDNIIVLGTVCTPAQPSAITGNAAPCLGASQVYSVTNVAGVTYNWSFPAGWTQTAGGTTNSVTVTTGAGSGNITVTPSNICGSGPAQILAVSTTLAVGAITGLPVVAPGQTGVTYSIPAVTNATNYSWSYTGTGASINGTGNSVTVNFAANATSGNLAVKVTNVCGNSVTSANFPITVSLYTVTPSSGLITTEAGGTATFTVKLNIRPNANVTIGLTSDDISEGTVTPASLTFTNANWNTAQTVTVRGVDDNFIDGIINYHIITAAAVSTDPLYNGSAVPDVDVANTDNDAVPAGSIEVDRKEPEGEMNASQLVQNVLIKGCLKASNIQFNKNSNATKDIQLGYFSKGTSDFPLKEGIIMSTGNVRDAEGPNIDPDKTTQTNTAGDNDINTITGRTSYDAAVLEFDFVPAGNKVQFNYIFASEEYGEFVGANYNDAFAFIISGPGIPQPKNIALLPGTSTPVSINNVHGPGYVYDNWNGVYTNTTRVYDPNGFYTANGNRYYNRITPTLSGIAAQNASYYVDNGQFANDTVMSGGQIQTVYAGGGGRSTEFDGRTTVLTATQDVQACQTYHIKLVVADVADRQYNSGVFLEAKSFTSNEVKVENLLMGADDDKDMMYEGCTNSFIRFVRNEESNINETVSFDVQISGTATNGVDYKYVDSNGNEIDGGNGLGVFPSKATIPAGQQYIDYYYKAVEDGIQEPNETAIFQVVNSCPCDPVVTYFTKTVTIIDAPKIQATATANVQCGVSGTPVATVNIVLQSGMDPNNYLFSLDGGAFQSSNQFTGNWPVGSTHSVQVKDKFSCQSATNSITIPAVSPIVAKAGPDKEMCRLQTGVQLNGSGGIYYEWSSVPAIGVNYLSDKNSAQPTVNPNIPAGTYTLTLLVQDQAGSTPLCSGTDDMVLTVKSTPIITATADTYEACSGTRINLNTSVTDGVAPLTYSWNPSAELSSASIPNPYFTPVVTGLSSRSFTVTVGNANGCSNTAQISNITINPPPVITINSVNKATCTGNADGSATITASGGTPGTSPAYTYNWKNSSNVTIGSASSITGLLPGAYTVTVLDGKSCSSTQTINIGIFETVPPVAKIKNPTIQLDASGNATISSTDIDNGSYDLCGPVSLSLNKTTFTCANLGANNVVLTVTDASGNISTATAVVTIQNPFAPTLSSSLNPAAVCSNTVLNYTPASTTAGVTFSWSRAAVAGISNAASTGTGDPAETLINTTNTTINVTYVYSLTANGCTNPTTYNVVVPVKPLPKLSSSLTPPDICSNEVFSYTPTSLSSGATFTWSRATVAGISNPAASGSGNPNEILYGTTKIAVNAIYIYSTTANGCSNSENVTVAVNPLPTTGPLYRKPNN